MTGDSTEPATTPAEDTTTTDTEAEASAPLILIDFEDLKLGELEDLEDYAGADAIARLFRGQFTPRAIVGLTWLTMRRADPAVTLEAVRELNITAVDFGTEPEAEAEAEAPNPTSSAG